MSINEYAEQVVNNFITDITDNVFLFIEQNESLRRDYESKVKLYGKNAVNTAIGKKVKKLLALKNTDKNKNPKGSSIKSYTRHEIKKQGKQNGKSNKIGERL